jgi:hypothetical protein
LRLKIDFLSIPSHDKELAKQRVQASCSLVVASSYVVVKKCHWLSFYESGIPLNKMCSVTLGGKKYASTSVLSILFQISLPWESIGCV